MRIWIILASLVVSLTILAGCGRPNSPAGRTGASVLPPASEEEYATTRVTDAGHFRVTYRSELDPVSINKIHTWRLHIETADGLPVENATIVISGGMPEHNHGMPTQPQVTANLGDGDYQVEGMKFQMPGWWTVTFVIDDGATQDSVTFNLRLQ
ncbi:MAG: FixH family protein [Caldilineaceae bacterium]|nr:FixH family protein [Caldilineaceae bacterium]